MEYDPDDFENEYHNDDWFSQDADYNPIDDGGPSQEDVMGRPNGFIWVRLHRLVTNSYIDWCVGSYPAPVDIKQHVFCIFPDWELEGIFTRSNNEH